MDTRKDTYLDALRLFKGTPFPYLPQVPGSTTGDQGEAIGSDYILSVSRVQESFVE